LRAAIINTYFAEEIRLRVADCGSINIKAYKYSKELIGEIKNEEKPWDKIDSDDEAVKSETRVFEKQLYRFMNIGAHFAALGCLPQRAIPLLKLPMSNPGE
jgi:hypothetical protein